jgi:hypothetical protein
MLRALISGAVAPHFIRVLAYRASLSKPLQTWPERYMQFGFAQPVPVNWNRFKIVEVTVKRKGGRLGIQDAHRKDKRGESCISLDLPVFILNRSGIKPCKGPVRINLVGQ